jgi:hypothetical protein
MKKTKNGNSYNNRGFITKNNTQDMRKDQFESPEKINRSVKLTTEDTPSGENSLPDLH